MQAFTTPTGHPATELRISGFRIEAPFKQGVLPAVAVNSDLSSYARLAIVALTFFGESSWPSHRTIARIMVCSLTRARKSLKELQEKDWLTIGPNRTEIGTQTTNTYVLHQPGRQGAPRCRHAIPPYRQAIPIQNQNSLREKKEEKNGAPQAEAPASLNTDSPKTPDEPRRATDAVDRLLGLFAERCQQAIGHSPPRVWGRDRKIVGNLVKQYGEQDAEMIIRVFVAYRARESKVITIPALAGAADAVYQRSRAGQSRKPIREHPNVRIKREWEEHQRRIKQERSLLDQETNRGPETSHPPPTEI